MKSIHTFLLMALLLCSFTCYSQENYYGIRLGYNIASLNSDASSSAIELSERNSFNAAFTYSHQLNHSPFGLSLELGYQPKGAKTNTDTLDYRLSYLNMPVMLDFFPIKKVRISAGPELGYLLKARNRSSDSTKVDVSNTFNKRFELSGTVSLSYSLEYFIDIGARYNVAFTRVANQSAILERRNFRNQYFQIFAFFKIAN